MEFNVYLAIVNFFMYVILFWMAWPLLFRGIPFSKSRYRIFLAIVFLFCIYSWWGEDWWGYLKEYYAHKNGYPVNLEENYLWIIDNLSPKYIYFRLVVWGGALLLGYLTIKRLSLNEQYAAAIFAVMYLPWFSFSRTSLAISIMFYGLSLVCNPYKFSRIISYVIGCSMILISYQFHKSAMFGTFFVLVALLFFKNPRTLFRILIFSFPILLLLAQYVMSIFMSMDIDIEEDALHLTTGQRTMDQSYAKHGIGALIQYRSYELLYLPIAYFSYKFCKSKAYQDISVGLKAFFKVAILLTFGAFLFSVDLGYNTDLLFFRFCNFIIIPATIILTYFRQVNYSRKNIDLIIKSGIFFQIYNISYAIYNMFSSRI